MRARNLFIGGLFMLSACGPSLSGLVRDKHYREAICAAQDGGEQDRRDVGHALDADAAFYVHMHVVSTEELRPVLEAATEQVSARTKLVRVSVQSNVLPIDAIRMEPSMRAESGKLAGVFADWQTLAWATQEKLPGKRTEKTYITGENVLKGGAAVLTLGFSLLFTDFEPGYVEVDPPLEAFEAMAPLASRLHRTTSRGGCLDITQSSSGAGKRCEWYFLLDNVSRDPVSLELRARYVSARAGERAGDIEEKSCVVERRFQMSLGPPAGIEAIVRERFGNEMRPVREVMRGD